MSSKELTPAQQLEKELQAYQNQQSNLKIASGKEIRIDQRKGAWKLDDTTVDDMPPVVVLGYKIQRSFWKAGYDKDRAGPPDCFALSDDLESGTPVPESPDIQSRETGNCQDCPMNEFGSAGKGKACKTIPTLAVVPLGSPEDDIHFVPISVGGVRHFKKYMATLRDSNLAPFQLETKLTIEDAGMGYTVGFDFSKLKPLPNEDVLAYAGRRGEAIEKLESRIPRWSDEAA